MVSATMSSVSPFLAMHPKKETCKNLIVKPIKVLYLENE